MIATWTPRTPRRVFNDNWWETSASLAIFGGLAVLCLIGLGTGDRRHWRWAGIAASIIACTMWLGNIWIGVGSDLGFVIFCALISLATVSVHANLSLVPPLKSEHTWIRRGTIGAAILTGGLIDLMIIDDKFSVTGIGYDFLGRLASAAGIVTGCGTLALCVLLRINRKVDFEPFSPELSEITLVCPRCRKKQAIRLGDSTCAACELRISIRIEEPRCSECDYLLYGLTSDRCPECGALIGAKTVTSEI